MKVPGLLKSSSTRGLEGVPAEGQAAKAAAGEVHRDASVSWFVVTAVVAAAFTVTSAFVAYRRTVNLEAERAWVDHTVEVLAALQSASLEVDRIDAGTRLYALTGGEDLLTTTRLSSRGLVTAALHIGEEVAEDKSQTASVLMLGSCSSSLAANLRMPKGSAISGEDDAISQCRQALDTMTGQERSLLKARSEDSQRGAVVSIAMQCALVALSLLTSAAMFLMLLRQSVARRMLDRTVRAATRDHEDVVLALEAQARESGLLTALRDELQLCVNLEDAYRSTTGFLSQVIEGSEGALCLINNSRNLVERVSTWGAGYASSAVMDTFPPESCCGLRSGRTRWRQAGRSELNCDHFAGRTPARYLCIPLAAHGDTIGVLHLECPDDKVAADVETRMAAISQMLQLAAMAIANLNLRMRLENQSIRDSLTGVFNRHFMQITLDKELSRTSRRQASCAIVMLDVDHFKRLNDRFGHASGDRVLQRLAEQLKNSVRTEDTVCRYGGEEFVIILPDISLENAMAKAEALRRAVSGLSVEEVSGSGVELTISMGVAMCPRDGRDWEALLRTADRALYSAKHRGRNRVVDAAELKLPAATEVVETSIESLTAA